MSDQKLSIGVCQMMNTNNMPVNLAGILKAMDAHKKAGCDVVLFPECALTGFSATIQGLDYADVRKAAAEIKKQSIKLGIVAVVPSALKTTEGEFINSGYIFSPKYEPQSFFKENLTESEQKLFVPKRNVRRHFDVNGFRLGYLTCLEAGDDPWKYFSPGTLPDAILWPSYWSWGDHVEWNNSLDTLGQKIFDNVAVWKRPLIQANYFANVKTDLRPSPPTGLSVVISEKNTLAHKAKLKTAEDFKVQLLKNVPEGILKLTKVSTL